MDLLQNNTTRMEATVCKSVDTSTTDTIIEKSAELVTTNDNNGQIVAANLLADEKKPPLEEQSSLKIKRCRHGRIIVKDLSKKKIVQQDDRETNQLQSKSTVESKEETHQSISTQEGIELTTAEQNCEVITQSINSTAAPVIAKSTDVINQSSSPVDLEKTLNIKLDKSHERKEKSPDEIISSKKVRSKSPDRRRSRSRSRTSYRKKVSNRSPSHRKSPRRDRDKSPRRRDRSRSLRSGKSSSRRLSSSRRRRSPRGESRSPPVRHRDRQSSRNRSPRRRRSHSRSSGRNTGHSCRNTSRSPRRETDDRERSSKIERATRRRDIYDINASDLNNQLITEVSKAVNLDKSNSSQLMNSETLLSNQPLKPQESSENTSSQNHNHKELQSNQPSELNNTHKSSQQEVSPSKPMSAHSSLSPSTNNSASSDIYDPEGPIIPISPGDSPPSLSSMNKAANNKIEYLVENERNDDDVPSSAVQLNHQEKYLQKLNRQERVVEEVKLALKPHYQRRAISKEQYKDVLRRAVPKVSVVVAIQKLS